MTQVIDVNSWEEFLEKLEPIKLRHEGNRQLVPTLLFRGQADHEWNLDTTLERNNKRAMLFTDYYRAISVLQPEIETYTNNRWEIPEYPDVIAMAGKYEFFRINRELYTSIYSYMSHLRHYGFPSPLLDWTRSPYVAAYFAFAEAASLKPVSIYVLSQATSSSGASNESKIITFGPHVRTHRRHFLQQSEYSLCAIFTGEDWQFVGHETADTDRDEGDGYLINVAIYKFNIPGSERIKVLKALEQNNLNAFSLFGTEESLMKTLAFREFHFRNNII